ncbi:MAG: fumarylacetoacetate hydrolase family protein [Alphaproteobacteria bacterium]|nr:fumarylacetoacetate hydrolase family protein [Alphaproteobacteria bacterium]
MSLLFTIQNEFTVPVENETAEYPVGRIFCVGRNYAAHAAEMGVEVDREAPFYFVKPSSAIVLSGATIPYPPGTENYHYEMELVVAIGAPAFRVSVADASKAIYGYAAGLDMTRRDLQLAARAKQRPWDLGKAFEQSAIIAPMTKAADYVADLAPQGIMLSVNGDTKQEATLGDLIHSVPELIADLSKYYHLVPGDLIYTGTPAGVGPVVPGDKIHGVVEGLQPVDLTIGEPE